MGGSNAQIRQRYIRIPGSVDEAFLMIDYENGGVERWAYPDERGSIVATTHSNGFVAELFQYDEYGRMTGNVGASYPFRYTGQRWDNNIGMYYYKARHYDPQMGRFLQPDPIGYGDGLNMYGYVKGNPVSFTDPTGLQCGSRIKNHSASGCISIAGSGNSGSDDGAALTPDGGAGSADNRSCEGTGCHDEVVVNGTRMSEPLPFGSGIGFGTDILQGSARDDMLMDECGLAAFGDSFLNGASTGAAAGGTAGVTFGMIVNPHNSAPVFFGGIGAGIGSVGGALAFPAGRGIGCAFAAVSNAISNVQDQTPSRTIPTPVKPKNGCTAICRADIDDRIPGNKIPGLPAFAFGQATRPNCPLAVKEAKRIATHNLDTSKNLSKFRANSDSVFL